MKSLRAKEGPISVWKIVLGIHQKGTVENGGETDEEGERKRQDPNKVYLVSQRAGGRNRITNDEQKIHSRKSPMKETPLDPVYKERHGGVLGR